MPSRSKSGRRGGDPDEEDEEVVTVSSDSDESESEAERGAEADDDDDEYVADSGDEGGVEDEAGKGGDSDTGDGGRLLRGGRSGVAEPDEERKSQNVDALVRYALARPFGPCMRVCGGVVTHFSGFLGFACLFHLDFDGDDSALTRLVDECPELF